MELPGFAGGMGKVFVHKGSGIIAERHDIVKQFKGPIQIFQRNQETTKQECSKPDRHQTSNNVSIEDDRNREKKTRRE